MDTNTLHEKATDYLAEGKTDEAREIYESILQNEPDNVSALEALMDIYEETDKFKYYIARANYNVLNGKLEYAINDCKKALTVDASNIEAREKLARLYKVTKKNLKAIDEFAKIIELDKEHLPSYIELIGLYSEEKAIESAIEIAIRANEIFGDRTNIGDILAKLYFDNGEYDKALEVVLDEGLKAKILLQDEKNEEAKAILDKMDENSLTKEQLAMYYLLNAQYCYNTDEYDKAFEYIDKYSSIMGPDAVSFQMRALCYEQKNDEFMAYYNYAFMNKAMDKMDEALVEFNHAYSINPKNKDVLIELARLYEKNNEKYTAIDFWQKVYELDNDEMARSILADFYLKEGDKLMAQKYGANFNSDNGGNGQNNTPEEEDEGLLNKLIGLFARNNSFFH